VTNALRCAIINAYNLSCGAAALFQSTEGLWSRDLYAARGWAPAPALHALAPRRIGCAGGMEKMRQNDVTEFICIS